MIMMMTRVICRWIWQRLLFYLILIPERLVIREFVFQFNYYNCRDFSLSPSNRIFKKTFTNKPLLYHSYKSSCHLWYSVRQKFSKPLCLLQSGVESKNTFDRDPCLSSSRRLKTKEERGKRLQALILILSISYLYSYFVFEYKPKTWL